jgi:hypothetical protein
MIVVVTGHRELGGFPEGEVSRLALVALRGATEVRLGGARGVDRIVLEALLEQGDAAVALFAPGQSLPQQTREVLARHSEQVDVHDVGGEPYWTPGDPSDRGAWLRRNEAMLRGDPDSPPAALLLAFSDGRKGGGTAYTVALAKRLGIPCVVVPMEAAVRNEVAIDASGMIEV